MALENHLVQKDLVVSAYPSVPMLIRWEAIVCTEAPLCPTWMVPGIRELTIVVAIQPMPTANTPLLPSLAATQLFPWDGAVWDAALRDPPLQRDPLSVSDFPRASRWGRLRLFLACVGVFSRKARAAAMCSYLLLLANPQR